MAGKNWQAGSKDVIPARALLCAAAIAFASAPARAASGGAASGGAASDGFAPVSYVASLDPNVLWEALIAAIVICAFIIAVALSIYTAMQRFKRSQARRNAFVSSALNNLSHGVVMTDRHRRVVFCNDRYLEIYGMSRADFVPNMTGPQLAELRRARGVLDCEVEDFFELAGRPEGLITESPNGKSVLVRYFPLPNGGSIATHEDCSSQRNLSRELASTKQFLESVLDNVPVCVAAKNIEDGRYIFANRAFERFSRFSRDHIVGKRADEIFRPDTAAGIEAADRAAVESREGLYRSELLVERGSKKRVLASNRVIARDETGRPEFLIALFDDITERRSLR